MSLIARLRRRWTGCEFCWTRRGHRALLREDNRR